MSGCEIGLTRILEDHLPLRSLEDIFLDGAFGDEPVDADMPLLSNPMSSGHRLQVILRVVVRLARLAEPVYSPTTHVEDDDRIRGF